LIVAADLAPVAAGDPALLLGIEQLRRWRALSAAPIAAAAILLVIAPPSLEQDLANLSPIPRQARDLDTELRSEIGAPDVGVVAIIAGASAEDVLQREEKLAPLLEALRSQGAIAGAEFASRFLPSAATQRVRQAAMPPREVLLARLAEAQAGLPFTVRAFEPFVRDVASEREMQPLAPGDLGSLMIAGRIAPQLFTRDGRWFGLVVPRGVQDAPALAAALVAIDGVTFLDIRAESNAIVARYTAQAWRWLSIGAAGGLAALLLGLRDWRRVAAVIGSLVGAGMLTVAVLSVFGHHLSLVHIVALQFVAGVGLDYAIFFARRQLDGDERARTLRTLVTCNAMTLLTFGMLAICQTPLLRDIGRTVAIGAVSALVLTFLWVGLSPVRSA
jgi:predicted exporter